MDNIIHKFYTAFNNLDAEGMVACYHDDVYFKDPAFGVLTGIKAKNMWRMLVESQKNKDFSVYFDSIKLDNEKGSAHWEAKYTFSQTGRPVHNIMEANFEIKEGQIIKHVDHFNLHRWAKQAFGFKGALIGGTGYFKNKLQQRTNKLLAQYEKKLK
ncbi:nuclear transport factor 2 family protein [Winogradskyella aurantiaca]|uniref:nuclear transport factor 2 family protein n=1 Tax=Winogradskyella aurantiaca TaxID=2219558 RepID=UPI000E1E0206|nr:nuclear transport factor 2 family protein [Winogradskyella aurantiaca]